MKRITVTAFATILVFLFSQCNTKEGSFATKKKISGNDVIVCDVTAINDTTPTLFSEIISKCEMIIPQASPESLMKSPSHIDVSENYIAIKSNGGIPVKLFTRDGKFVRNIGAIGRGPGEYGSLYGIQLDESRNRIFLTPFANADRLLVFDLEGNSLPAIPLTHGQAKTRVYVNQDTLTVLGMRFDKNHPFAYQQTIDGKIIKEAPLLDHLIVKPDFSNEIYSGKNGGSYDIFILDWYRTTPDTLYHFNVQKNSLEPKFVLEGKPIDDLKENAYENPVASLFELKRHYHGMISGSGFFKRVIVDKKTLKAKHFKLINDFYGGIELTNIFSTNNGLLIASIPAVRLMAQLEQMLNDVDIHGERRKQLTEMLESLDENDNDVIFLGEMI